MGTTVADAVEAARNWLLPLTRERLNVLAEPVDAVATGLTFTDTNGPIVEGVTLGIDYEVAYVRAVPTSTTATVLRGQRGTTAAAHTAGAVVEVRPRFPRGLILAKLIDELRGWPPDLYRVLVTPVTATAGIRTLSTGLTQDTEVVDILNAWIPGPAGDTTASVARLGFRSSRSGSAELGGTVALVLDEAAPYAASVYVEYAAPFDLTALTGATDLIADVGLAPSQLELAYLGAARRCITEMPRTDTAAQSESRLAEDVAPGQITSIREDLDKQYAKVLNREVARMLRKYPYRSR